MACFIVAVRFVVYTCVAVILGKREALLSTDKQFSLAEAEPKWQVQIIPAETDKTEIDLAIVIR